jgi:16S rRNA processing protein rimM
MFEGIDVIVGERVLLEKDSRRKVLLVKSVKRINEKKAIINFEGINNIDLAKELNGLQIKIRRDLLPEKTEDDFYLKDLLGVEVFEKGEKIGEVIDIMETAAHDILVIQDIKNHKEILVPQIDVFVKKIDFDNNKMDVELIDGMREETNEN